MLQYLVQAWDFQCVLCFDSCEKHAGKRVPKCFMPAMYDIFVKTT